MKGNLYPTEAELCAAKILIVDDEEAYIRAIEFGLRQAKFSNVRSLTESADARAEFDRFQPDLVMLDLNMPEPDGFAVLKDIRESSPEAQFVPVLVLTGQNTAETRSRALAAGASDFLGKPIDYSEVLLRIKNLLQTRFLHRQARAMQTRLDNLPDDKKSKS